MYLATYDNNFPTGPEFNHPNQGRRLGIKISPGEKKINEISNKWNFRMLKLRTADSRKKIVSIPVSFISSPLTRNIQIEAKKGGVGKKVENEFAAEWNCRPFAICSASKYF